MKYGVELTKEAEKAIRACFVDVPFVQIEDIKSEPVIGLQQPDILVRLKAPTGEVNLIVEVKSNGQPRIVREAINQIEYMIRGIPNVYGVIIAPYISPKSAEICAQKNIGYIDLAGNCRISFWPVYIQVTGKKNPFAEKRGLKSLFSQTSIKTITILRILLENPKRVWKTQELADSANASLGQISNVKRQLEDREWLQSSTEGFKLTDPVALLSDWSRYYDTKLNRTFNYYSIKSIPEIETELAQLCAKENIKYALTGFSGGARYAPTVRYQRVMAYTSNDAIAKVVEGLDLKEVPSGANINLVSPYDQNVFYGSRKIDDIWIASPIQVYLDLKSISGRGEEAAEALLKKEIEPKWQ